MSDPVTIGIDCGYRTGGVARITDTWSEVHDLPVYSEGGVDVVALLLHRRDLLQHLRAALRRGHRALPAGRCHDLRHA